VQKRLALEFGRQIIGLAECVAAQGVVLEDPHGVRGAHVPRAVHQTHAERQGNGREMTGLEGRFHRVLPGDQLELRDDQFRGQVAVQGFADFNGGRRDICWEGRARLARQNIVPQHAQQERHHVPFAGDAALFEPGQFLLRELEMGQPH
jgi:hypothetical protein